VRLHDFAIFMNERKAVQASTSLRGADIVEISSNADLVFVNRQLKSGAMTSVASV
jgi:hypothetical protein